MMLPVAPHSRTRWALRLLDDSPLLTDSGDRNLLSLLPDAEQLVVLRFLKPVDQRRALASRLLQRACVCRSLAVPWRSVSLARTRGGKPFTTCVKPAGAPNFNYNVSHEVYCCKP